MYQQRSFHPFSIEGILSNHTTTKHQTVNKSYFHCSMEENREEGLTQKSKLHVETSDEETSQQISEEKSKS